MRTLGVIPARGGSKGLPGKNLMRLGGKSLVQWAIESAKAATTLHRVILDSDSRTILDSVGDEVEIFLRHPDLARDETGMVPVLQNVVRAAEDQDGRYDLVVCLQPTSPFRTGEDIDATVSLVTSTGAESAQTLVEAPYCPGHVCVLREHAVVDFPTRQHAIGDHRRQECRQFLIPSGAVYVTKREVLMAGRIIGEDHRGLMVPKERSVNINDIWDFRLAEAIYAQMA